MLEEELISFQAQQEHLYGLMCAIGTADDSPALRKNIIELKQILAVAESSISNRIKGEVPEHEIERHATLEDGFFELKANYFALLRQCVSVESTPLSESNYTPPSHNQGPDVQRYGNPHASPALQTMQHSSAPIPQTSLPVENANMQSHQSLPPIPQKPTQPLPQQPMQVYDNPPLSQDQQSSPLYQQQQQVNTMGEINIGGIELQKRDSVFWDAKELVEREEELKLISSEMVHLEDAFQDMATEVDVQTEQEEQVEKQVEEAKANTKEGVQTLGKSAKNSKKILLPGAGAGVGGVAGAACGGVIGTLAGGTLAIPGAVVGAAIGASAGATFGHGVGKIIRKVNDKDMAKARLSENWRPDSSSKNCEGCSKKFTQVKRRHHCRNCGGLFCGKCTKHKMYIPGVATESRPRVCRKCFEALMYHQQGIKPPSQRTESTPNTPPMDDTPPVMDGTPPQNGLPPVPERPNSQ